MGDLEAKKHKHHNMGFLEELLEVAAVTTKKYDSAHMNNKTIEPDLERIIKPPTNDARERFQEKN